MNRAQAALDHANTALALRPRDVAIMRAWTTALRWVLKPDEVILQLRDVEARTPLSIQDKWIKAGTELIRGNPGVAQSAFAEAIAQGPTALRSIDTARISGLTGDPRAAARHLERAFQADPSCVAFIAQSPAFASFREHPAIQDVMSKHRAP